MNQTLSASLFIRVQKAYLCLIVFWFVLPSTLQVPVFTPRELYLQTATSFCRVCLHSLADKQSSLHNFPLFSFFVFPQRSFCPARKLCIKDAKHLVAFHVNTIQSL